MAKIKSKRAKQNPKPDKDKAKEPPPSDAPKEDKTPPDTSQTSQDDYDDDFGSIVYEFSGVWT